MLVAEGLTWSAGGRRIVDDVGLAVHAGEVVGLLGPNGAGKTSTFRMVAGLLTPDAGSVRLGERDLGRLPLWKRVRAGLGYLPQAPTIFRRLSVRDNVRLALADGDGDDRADALLAQAGLNGLAAQQAGSLSGGERRRLEIARCLAARPRVLLLDEPFAGVDPVSVEGLQQRIRALATDEGLGILVTDHAVRETLGICARAVILDQGRVMATGTPAEVAADPRVRARYLGDTFRLPTP
ncbi:MAG: LPS export ABC transporter ATP-binding protein [Alphaproteobacteria bacterium]|nr:LPS export ABC transporter ATP-binding protein [Alphaproteobacteria bacterium]